MAKKLKNLNRRIDALKKGGRDSIAFKAAVIVAGETIKNWLSLRGADGRAYRGAGQSLSDDYAAEKAATGRDAVPNMVYSGSMTGAFSPRKTGDHEYTITTRGSDANGKSNIDKLRMNQKLRPNLMLASHNKTLADKINKIVLMELKK